jgi:hypothetical protein
MDGLLEEPYVWVERPSVVWSGGRMDPDRTNPASGSHLVHGYSPWAPRGLVGETRWAGITSLVCGVAALALAAFGILASIAWLTALLSIALVLAVLLPRATVPQKVASGLGVACALVAVMILLA